MERDEERIERNRMTIKEENLDALVCTLPMNVLLLSGYWPVIGTSAAIFTRDGKITLLVPEDEQSLAELGFADEVFTFSTGGLDEMKELYVSISTPLSQIAGRSKIAGRVGYESGPASVPVSYASMNVYGAAMPELLETAFPNSVLVPAGAVLTRLRSTLTQQEIVRVTTACDIAAAAFTTEASKIRPGQAEAEIASAFRRHLSGLATKRDGPDRADGFIYCMSGENSYEAFAAFQRTGRRRVLNGDLVLVHCNSYLNGFWTDITRTFCIGEYWYTRYSDRREHDIGRNFCILLGILASFFFLFQP